MIQLEFLKQFFDSLLYDSIFVSRLVVSDLSLKIRCDTRLNVVLVHVKKYI